MKLLGKIVLLVCCCAYSTIVSAQTHSFQIWTGLESSVDISKRFSIDFEAEARFQQTSATLKQASAEIGARYNITKPLFVSASYEFANKYRSNGYFPVHTIAGTLGYKKKLGDFKFAVQTKLNISKNTYIKDNESLIPDIVDKNKIKITYVANKRIKPSVFVESYHIIEPGSHYHVSTVKYGANCSFGFRKQIDFDLGYMLRQEIDDNELISVITISVSKSF